MKKAFILIVISIAVFAITLSCHAVDATDAKVILFNDEMDINAWSYWWGNYTSYDAGEGAYKVSFRTDGSPATCMEMDTGNQSDYSLLEDIGITPFTIFDEGAYNFVKVRIKTQNGFKPSCLSAHLGTTEYLSDTSPWIQTGVKLGDLTGIEDGEWHEYIFDLNQIPQNNSWLTEEDIGKIRGMLLNKISLIIPEKITASQAVLYQYIAFFKTAEEAESFSYTYVPPVTTEKPDIPKNTETETGTVPEQSSVRQTETAAGTKPDTNQTAPEKNNLSVVLIVVSAIVLVAGAATVIIIKRNKS
jgi:hypothetical protein